MSHLPKCFVRCQDKSALCSLFPQRDCSFGRRMYKEADYNGVLQHSCLCHQCGNYNFNQGAIVSIREKRRGDGIVSASLHLCSRSWTSYHPQAGGAEEWAGFSATHISSPNGSQPIYKGSKDAELAKVGGGFKRSGTVVASTKSHNRTQWVYMIHYDKGRVQPVVI